MAIFTDFGVGLKF